MSLRKNQYRAVMESIDNNFSSGVHCHATGTGKSWIALEIILAYNKKYPSRNIIWLCEQKSILIEQFNRNIIKTKGYDNIFKKFLIVNYTERKPSDWFKNVNSARIWGKPLLLIINRSFLVSNKKYEKISISFDLIIHDECHSISNKTTRQFYRYILDKNKKISCLGFSATPNLEIEPFNKVISNYSIYDAYCDDVIVPPLIKWVKCDNVLTNKNMITICGREIKKLYYKKIIVWCGMIELCKQQAALWNVEFDNFLICLDTSKECDLFGSFDEFSKAESNAILFCACKHREGSDIKNLDGCIFLDKVENRNAKTFVQCIGRVLRKDMAGKKNSGLILDLKAASCLKICDRMNTYLNNTSGFPWEYNYNYETVGNKKIMMHSLLLKKNIETKQYIEKNYKLKHLTQRFIIECPSNKIYVDRLYQELEIIAEKKLTKYLIRATEILKLTNYIPHVTRGSCGSSLVCYLLGISNVDPIEYGITFERFLNEYRDNLPDIDLDFPHFLRDEVFLKLELTWPNQVARISNHVHWHEKSALREALRHYGYKQKIPKEQLYSFVRNLPKNIQKNVKDYQSKLNNTFRHYSLHCGGIVFFHEGIPNSLIFNKSNERKVLTQIICDKRDIAKEKNFKIDILSSRGLSQLIGVCGLNIDFSECSYDEKTYKLLQEGDNIGITLAESPLMRKALLKIRPKSITDIAICLAIIRPAAKDARIADNDIDFHSKFIFDDDAIMILSKKLNIDKGLADKFRRCIGKNKWNEEVLEKYNELMDNIDPLEKEMILLELANLRKYSFCKSHSYSYAQLVYKLAYEKAHNTKRFWEATLKNVNSSYRKWVHLYEAKLAGVNVEKYIAKTNDCSIYAANTRSKFYKLSKVEQFKKYGYWSMTTNDFYPNCYFYQKDDGIFYFGGIIASMRCIGYGKSSTAVISLGVAKGKYIEIIVKNKYCKPNSIGVKGRAYLKDVTQQTYQAFIAKFY